jgi:HK97 family phage portal protein
VTSLLRAIAGRAPRRSNPALGFDDWINYFNYGGAGYGFLAGGGTLAGNEEPIESSFSGYVQGAYKRNGVVFACMLARMLLFSEARFQFRNLRGGRPGDLFGTKDLALLETPWPNGTTGNLLSRMIQDADLAGNFYAAYRPGPALRRMRPDWVTIVLGSPTGRDIDMEVIGYAYRPDGVNGDEIEVLRPETVVHFAPIPDPIARFRGMSWLTPVLREIQADSAATTHKQKFFENGATPNLVVKLGETVLDPELFQTWVDKFEGQHEGVLNAYKTLYLAAGADAQVVGADMKQIDFKVTQGAGETRIAAAGGVPPVIVGLSEGLQAATYSNYAQARRRFADMTMRPLWREAAASLAPVVTVPRNAQLWYDDRDIPALQEDRKDAAEIAGAQATTIKTLIEAGYEPDSVQKAIAAEDWGLLKHSGLVSVQLQPPGTPGAAPALTGAKAAELFGDHRFLDALRATGRIDIALAVVNHADAQTEPALDGAPGRRLLEQYARTHTPGRQA